MFWVNLIIVFGLVDSARKTLEEYCTHVYKDVYIMEGDLDVLYDEGFSFNLVSEGAVDALGGLSEKELIKICDEVFAINVRKLKYDETKRYIPED